MNYYPLTNAVNDVDRYAWIQILAGTLLMAICSQIYIPLPFSPVPFTMQTLAIIYLGGILGSRKAALCLSGYLLEGLIGLPVFAEASSGILPLVGPTGGYLLAYIPQAYIIGRFIETRPQTRFIKMATLFVCTCLLQLCVGAIWLSAYVGISNAIFMGIIPFLLGDMLKCLIAALYFSKRLR